MTGSAPLFSVVITNYNYAAYLAECIDSVLGQTWPNVEVIVVDDGSTDASREVLRAYEGRARILLQENAGQAAGFNAGVAASHGDFIALLDSDDGWHPHKLERVHASFTADTRIQWVRHKLALVDEHGRRLGLDYPRFAGSGLVRPDAQLLLERIISAGTTIVFRRELAQRVFPLAAGRQFAFDADALLLARVFQAGALGYSLDEELGYYRRHSGQRYVQGMADVERMLRREIEVGLAMAKAIGSRRVPVSVYKHGAIIAALQGARWWSRGRAGNAAAGTGAAMSLLAHPRLCIRQLAALWFAAVAPRSWLRRFERSLITVTQ